MPTATNTTGTSSKYRPSRKSHSNRPSHDELQSHKRQLYAITQTATVGAQYFAPRYRNKPRNRYRNAPPAIVDAFGWKIVRPYRKKIIV